MLFCTFLFGTQFALFQGTTLVSTTIYEGKFKEATVNFDLAHGTVLLTEKGKSVLLTLDCKDGSKN